jgi:hypothetical protein
VAAPEPEPVAPDSVEPVLAQDENIEPGTNGNGHHEDGPADILAPEKEGSADEQARFRRLRAKAHFAESLRRIPPLGRNRAAH